MTSGAALQIEILTPLLFAAILLASTLRMVPAGKIGLVFLFGAYKRTIKSGANLVPLFARARYVEPGSGPNGVLGLVGIAESQLSIDGPMGSVRIGEKTIPARSPTNVSAGSTIRVIQDIRLGAVLVAEEFSPPVARGGSSTPLSSPP